MTPGSVADSFVPVAVTDRSGVDESYHFGAVVVLDPDGSVAFSAGRPDVEIYPRSATKPVQADAMLGGGWIGTPEQLALACASHDGSPVHIEIVRSILADAGLDESALGNTPDWPLDRGAAEAAIAAGAVPTSLFMNCSGKHATMLATCRVNDWPLAGYQHPDHPLQLLITQRVEQLMGKVAHIGIDGCGAPAHVVSLSGLARSYARLAHDRGEVWDAMHRFPELVGGPDRASARLVAQLPDAMAKEGAEGTFAAGLPDGTAVAVKIADGSARAAGVVAASALAGVGHEVEAIAIGDPVRGHGRPVGQLRPLVGGG